MNVTRREFLRGLTLAGTAGLLGWRTADPPAAEPPPETTRLRVHHSAEPLSGPPVCRRRPAARRGLHRRAVRASRAKGVLRGARLRRGRHRRRLRHAAHHSAGQRDADRGPRRDPRRLLRAVRHRAGPDDPRPERQDRRRARAEILRRTPFSPAWRPTSAWILARTSPGLRIRRTSRCGSWAGERSMRSSGSPRSRRSCARSASATLWSTAPWTGPGLSTSVACPSPIGTSRGSIRWPRSEHSARS